MHTLFLVDLLSKLGFSCEPSCGMQEMRQEHPNYYSTTVFHFQGNLSAQTGLQSCLMKSAVESSLITSERFKCIVCSPSTNPATLKSSKLELLVEKPESKCHKVRRSINYSLLITHKLKS